MWIGDTNSADNRAWLGPIQKGNHVRVIGHSRVNVNGVATGDVGVVKSRDSDGNFVIDFPRTDNWCASPSDIVLDPVAEIIRPGALVKVKDSVIDPLFGWGSYQSFMHGLVFEVKSNGVVCIQLGLNPDDGQCTWRAQLKELEVVDTGAFQGGYHGHWQGRLQLGMAVRIPSHLTTPSTGWGNLKRGEVGYVCGFKSGSNLCVCNFPSVDGWQGREQDLEVDEVATLIRPGKYVRVRPGISEPQGGWGGISPSSVGIVRSSRYDGDLVEVKFPEHSSWKGRLSELDRGDG